MPTDGDGQAPQDPEPRRREGAPGVRPPFDPALWPELRALVLGASGAIGRHLVDALLRRGVRVRALLRPQSEAPTLAGLPIERIQGDIKDPDSIERALRGCDLLFHCAAPYPRGHFHKGRQIAAAAAAIEGVLAAARRCVSEELLRLPAGRLRRIEIEQAEGAAASLRLQPEREAELRGEIRRPALLDSALADRLDASLHPPLAQSMRLPGLKRLVYVSSVTTIGRPHGRNRALSLLPANEDDRFDRIRASSPYFRMKEEMEDAVTRAAVEGLPAVITNPTFCIDAYDVGPTSGQLLISLARRALPVYLPGTINAVATRDVGEGLVLAAAHGRTGRRYILGGANLTVREFLDLAAEVAGVRPPRAAVPLVLAEGIAWASECLNLVLRRPWPFLPLSGVQMLRMSQPVDARRAVEELGMPQTPIRDAVAAALAWFRDNGYI